MQPRAHLVGGSREAQAAGEESEWLQPLGASLNLSLHPYLYLIFLACGRSASSISIYISHGVTALAMHAGPENEDSLTLILKYLMRKKVSEVSNLFLSREISI